LRGWRPVGPLALRTRLKTLAANGIEDLLPVLGAVRLENQLDRTASDMRKNDPAPCLPSRHTAMAPTVLNPIVTMPTSTTAASIRSRTF